MSAWFQNLPSWAVSIIAVIASFTSIAYFFSRFKVGKWFAKAIQHELENNLVASILTEFDAQMTLQRKKLDIIEARSLELTNNSGKSMKDVILYLQDAMAETRLVARSASRAAHDTKNMLNDISIQLDEALKEINSLDKRVTTIEKK